MILFSKNQVNFYEVTEKDEGQRLDNLLVKLLKGVPKSYIYRIIRAKEVKVNNKKAEIDYKVKLKDEVRIPPLKQEINHSKPTKKIPPLNFVTLFEDDYFLVIDKPSGVACHGGSGVSFGVIEQLRQTLKPKFLELAHRLDRDTSGVLILAKKRLALVGVQELIRNSKIAKHYTLLSLGKWVESIKKVDAPLFKYLQDNGERRVRVDTVKGLKAYTVFSVIERFNEFTLVKADIKTGRTHQIRVHLQHLGHPIAGDDKYGDFLMNKLLFKNGLKRMFLHASLVEFIHPITNQKLTIKSDLPGNLKDFINQIKQQQINIGLDNKI